MAGYYSKTMKRAADQSSAIRQPASSYRSWMLGLGCWMLLFHFIASASALTEANPYSKIIGRNTFALKAPPPPPAPLVAPPAPPPKVSLQGISTILGRAQALLKVKIDPKPSEPAKDLSLVMDVGQREGEVEVLSIDPAAGTVNISNQGTPLTLSIKDADKPAAGPAAASTPVQTALPVANPYQLNTIPTQTLPPAMTPPSRPAGGGTSFIPFGGALPVPTRPLRGGAASTDAAQSTPADGLSASGNTQSSYQPPTTGLSVDEQMAVLAVQHKASEGTPNPLPLPPLPARYLINNK